MPGAACGEADLHPMTALPTPFDVASPAAADPLVVERPAWVDGVVRAARVAGMCALVLLVPGEAYRCSAGGRIPRP